MTCVVFGTTVTTIGFEEGSSGWARAVGWVPAAGSAVGNGIGSRRIGTSAFADGSTTDVNAESGIEVGRVGSMPLAAAAASVKVPAAMIAAVAISRERGARKGNR
jgi:hypothetical protein